MGKINHLEIDLFRLARTFKCDRVQKVNFCSRYLQCWNVIHCFTDILPSFHKSLITKRKIRERINQFFMEIKEFKLHTSVSSVSPFPAAP